MTGGGEPAGPRHHHKHLLGDTPAPATGGGGGNPPLALPWPSSRPRPHSRGLLGQVILLLLGGRVRQRDGNGCRSSPLWAFSRPDHNVPKGAGSRPPGRGAGGRDDVPSPQTAGEGRQLGHGGAPNEDEVRRQTSVPRKVILQALGPWRGADGTAHDEEKSKRSSGGGGARCEHFRGENRTERKGRCSPPPPTPQSKRAAGKAAFDCPAQSAPQKGTGWW